MHCVPAREDGRIEWWNSDALCMKIVQRGEKPSKILLRSEQDEVDIFAKLSRAVEHAGLAAHKQGLYLMFPDRRKDLSDRGRDQGCLPSPDIEQRAFRSDETAPLESNRSIPSIHRACLRTSCSGKDLREGDVKSELRVFQANFGRELTRVRSDNNVDWLAVSGKGRSYVPATGQSISGSPNQIVTNSASKSGVFAGSSRCPKVAADGLILTVFGHAQALNFAREKLRTTTFPRSLSQPGINLRPNRVRFHLQ